jgi:hypothetical protein
VAILYQLILPIIFRSSSYSSVSSYRSLPLLPLPSILAVTICFGILPFPFLSMHPYQLNRSVLTLSKEVWQKLYRRFRSISPVIIVVFLHAFSFSEIW